MGFIAPALPYIAKIGASIGSSLLGNALGGSGIPSIAQPAYNQLTQTQDQGNTIARQLTPAAINQIQQASQTYQQPLSYEQAILGGGRQALMSATAPQVNAAMDAMRANQAAQAQLAPRGGGRATSLLQAPFQAANIMGNLFQQARQAAVPAISGIAQGIGSLATPMFGMASSGLNAATSAGQSLLNFVYNQNQANRQAGNLIGQGIQNLLNPAGGGGLNSIFDKLGTLGGGVTPTWSMLNPAGYGAPASVGTSAYQYPTLVGGPNLNIGTTPSTTGNSILWGG